MLLIVCTHRTPGIGSHRLLLWKLLWLKSNNIFFHYEIKFTVISFPSKKDSKAISTSRLSMRVLMYTVPPPPIPTFPGMWE